MQLDDRDIICETDYSPLSHAELVAQIEWHASAMSGATAYDLERITGPARALLARAEAAEAERDELRSALLEQAKRAVRAEMKHAKLAQRRGLVAPLTTTEDEAERAGYIALIEQLRNERDRAEARAAELEAQLAAQQWRPVTEKPVVTMQYQVVVQHSRQQPTADHMAYYPSSGWTGTDVIFWRPIPPLPPAPQETE